jgi:hypothetical protein
MPAKKKPAKKAPKKKIFKKVLKKAKKVVKKPAKKKATKKAVKKPPKKKVLKKTPPKKVAPKKVAPLRRGSGQAKKVAPKQTATEKKEEQRKIAGAKKKIAAKEYQMTIPQGVLPSSESIAIPSSGKMPAVTKNFPEHLKPVGIQNERLFFTGDEAPDLVIPSLVEMQVKSYEWFLTEGLKELMGEISPITDFSGKKMELRMLGHTFDPPKYDPDTCRRRNLSFESVMKGHVQLINKETGEIKEQDVFLGSIPLMTNIGTFIVGGIERVVVHQLVRSPGVFFSRMPDNPKLHAAKIIPKRGVWLEIETDRRGIISCKIDRKRKIPITQLLRIFGFDTDEKIINVFSEVIKEKDYILTTLDKDPAKTVEDAYQSVYRKVRPGDLATPENAKQLIDAMFFDFKKYDMGAIARYKMNRRFGFKTSSDEEHRVFQVEDFVEILKELIKLNNGEGVPDDIDHLSNRRAHCKRPYDCNGFGNCNSNAVN